MLCGVVALADRCLRDYSLGATVSGQRELTFRPGMDQERAPVLRAKVGGEQEDGFQDEVHVSDLI